MSKLYSWRGVWSKNGWKISWMLVFVSKFSLAHLIILAPLSPEFTFLAAQ